MRKTVRKLFWVWQFEKEEQWLAEMAAQGWNLVSVGYCRYEFEQSEPNEYTVRLEMLENNVTSAKSQDYISFVESTGAEYIGHMLKWVYFRKKTADGAFDLYSDIDSRIRHLKRIIAFLSLFLCLNAVNTLNMANLFIRDGDWASMLIFILVAAVTGVLLFGVIRLSTMKKHLEKDRFLHE